MTKQVQNIGIELAAADLAAGAPVEVVSKVELPPGLSLETFNAAVDAISRWEDGEGEIDGLVADLYHLITGGGMNRL